MSLEPFDKSSWGDGPWQTEPDYVEWIDEVGLRCEARRSPAGSWMGYVEIPYGHPWFARHVDLTLPALRDVRVEVSGSSAGDWWIGFGCYHIGEYNPKTVSWEVAHGFDPPPATYVYRTLEYVKEQCSRLAAVVVVQR